MKHYLDQGVSKAELSRRFGVSRRTIYSWIESGQLDRDLSKGESSYTPRPRVVHKLDPYKGIIHERPEQFPKLSAQRLFDEVRAAGWPPVATLPAFNPTGEDRKDFGTLESENPPRMVE
ncbi:MAG: helix-turn-helix domain-containing protein [Rhodospirillaceae bacterium]|nr:helix-turn-helix domain-containing protein [Rhodospirillaceae bacterium]